ncbi:hypothetical protein CG08_1362 [Riemerella anatipestifer]|nr:hypothetical protein G148_0381 [Riemerella anatipestifer RA-CH-2]AKP69582.1 hypothetical protein CG08_1362 [Riemerella anatipestifer]AKP71489.1 hypothetical protein CG09_1303 [Riemerella anatipestifer]
MGFVSLFQYLFYFLFGVFFYNYWNCIKNFIQNKFFLWIIIFLSSHFLLKDIIDINLNNYYLKSFYKLIFIFLLNITVLSFAFSYRDISDKILRKQDISYGIYIYHMLIINIFIQYNIPIKTYSSFSFVLLGSIVMGSLSWFLIEKPILKKK